MTFFERAEMIIEIERIPNDGLKVSRDFEFASDDLVEENTVFLEPVHVEGTIYRVGEEILIKGQLTTRLNLICCRCLSPYEFLVDSEFDLIFLPEDFKDPKEQLEPEDMSKLFYQKQSIDFKEVILEQLNLTFPMRPLCSDECQGLCPVCGNRIDDGTCSCTENELDQRLVKLKTFLKDRR
jgi:uncharacterized protein